MNLGLKNKRVVITGSSKGIGAEIARQFAEEKCRVTLIARDKNKLNEITQEIGGEKFGHTYICSDLKNEGAPKQVFNELIKIHKKIDIVIHNVGGGLGIKNPLADLNEWIKVWNFNVGIAISLNSLIIPLMKKNKWGRIVHVSSISAITGGTMVKPMEEPLLIVAQKHI